MAYAPTRRALCPSRSLSLVCNIPISLSGFSETNTIGYYDFFRAEGLTAAQTAWTNTLALPLTLCRDADDTFIQRIGVIKVEERISFADGFALALAERLNIPLVTTDHHEFDAIERKGHFRFLWLR